MMRTIRLLLGGMAIALVAACGGGGSSTTAPAAVARVEILPSAVVLTSVGAAKQLVAKAFDADGNEVAASFTWSSTSAAKIGVSASGVLNAITASGSSQVTASAGGIVSAPVLAIVTTLPAGAVALTDAQIVGEPIETTPDAAPSFDNTYQVSLTGVAAPAVGTLLINTEGKAVAGRVLAVDTSVNPIKVTLGLVSLREMFPSLELREVIDMSNAPVTIPADIAAVYNVKRTGDLFEFTPKPGASATQLPSGRKSALAGAVGTSALPPFSDCNKAFTGRSAEDPLPIALSAPPVFSIKLTPTLDIVYTEANGLERFLVKASPVFTVEGGITVTAAFEGKVECKHEMVVYRIPVGGPLSLVISGLVPAGIGLEVAGKVTVATLGLSTKLEVKSDAEIGVQCAPGAACEFVKSLTFPTPAVALTPTVNLPSIGDLRVEPSLAGFGYVEAAIGNPLLSSLRLDAFAAKAGGKYAASFAPMVSQITDTSYKSDYKVSLEASAGVGTGLGDVAKLLGLSSISALDLSISTDIATSPSGVAIDAVTADTANFVTGDTVNFTVKLDPATVEFPRGLFYNVDKVVLVRNSGGNREIVGTATATAGQTTFNIALAAPDSGQASEFFAFVVTRLLPFDLLSLEVGQATGPIHRMSATLPASITTSAPLDVTVELQTADGSFSAAPNQLVTFTPTCASVNPTSGRTDASGRFATTVTPTQGCTAVSVVATASVDVGTPTLAEKTVSAAVSRTRPLGGAVSAGAEVGVSFQPGTFVKWGFTGVFRLGILEDDKIDAGTSTATGTGGYKEEVFDTNRCRRADETSGDITGVSFSETNGVKRLVSLGITGTLVKTVEAFNGTGCFEVSRDQRPNQSVLIPVPPECGILVEVRAANGTLIGLDYNLELRRSASGQLPELRCDNAGELRGP